MAVLRSSVISKKSTTFLLASMVICKLLRLKILHISFLIASTCLGSFVQVVRTSPLYNPTLTSRWVGWDNKNSHTSSLVSGHRSYPLLLRSPTSFCAMACHCYRECSFCVLDNPSFISRDFYVVRGEIKHFV